MSEMFTIKRWVAFSVEELVAVRRALDQRESYLENLEVGNSDLAAQIGKELAAVRSAIAVARRA